MVVNMGETRLTTIAQIEQFLVASAVVQFTPSQDDEERYAHISRVLKRFDYPRLGKADKGVLLRYLGHTSGYSDRVGRGPGGLSSYLGPRSSKKSRAACAPLPGRKASARSAPIWTLLARMGLACLRLYGQPSMGLRWSSSVAAE
ncbi:hypothetical protein [Verminephrobacter aporrectodeae]|uniref:hypothetical protein n=1 Tax=Verminephrobacter aporrectodeae TaxID=1110389 RepID=UPI001110427D